MKYFFDFQILWLYWYLRKIRYIENYLHYLLAMLTFLSIWDFGQLWDIFRFRWPRFSCFGVRKQSKASDIPTSAMSSRLLRKLQGDPGLPAAQEDSDPEREAEEDDLLSVAAGGGPKKKQFNVNRYDLVCWDLFYWETGCS